MEWQAIETAPKDGTSILTVGTDSKSVIETRWLDPGPMQRRVDGLTWRKDAGWYWASWGEPVGPVNATDWMPMPKPPLASGGDVG